MWHLVVSMSLFVFGVSVTRYCVYPCCFVSCHVGFYDSVILCCIIGNAVDTTQDACQGDSGGPLVGHFNDQIKPLELFPDELEDVVDIDIKDVLPHQKPKEELSQLEDETDINKIYEEDQSDSDNIDPNDMRLEDFVKLDLRSNLTFLFPSSPSVACVNASMAFLIS